MVKIKLCWSRDHIKSLIETMNNRLLKDDKSEYFDVNLYLDGCNISIERGEIKQ